MCLLSFSTFFFLHFLLLPRLCIYFSLCFSHMSLAVTHQECVSKDSEYVSALSGQSQSFFVVFILNLLQLWWFISVSPVFGKSVMKLNSQFTMQHNNYFVHTAMILLWLKFVSYIIIKNVILLAEKEDRIYHTRIHLHTWYWFYWFICFHACIHASILEEAKIQKEFQKEYVYVCCTICSSRKWHTQMVP